MILRCLGFGAIFFCKTKNKDFISVRRGGMVRGVTILSYAAICMERVKSFLIHINIVFHLASYKSANTIISHFMWDFLKILDSRGLLKGRSQVTSKTGNYKFKQLCFFPAQYRQCAQSVRNGTTEKHRKFAKKRMGKNHGKKSYKATAKQVIFAKFPYLLSLGSVQKVREMEWRQSTKKLQKQEQE